MPPKRTFTKDDVIKAAFDLVENDCLECMTARNIAKKLGSSTAPVYSYFVSIKELEKEVITRARDLLLDYSIQKYTDIVFLNMGVGICVFAREYPNLYHALFLEREDFNDIVVGFLDTLRIELRKDERFVSLEEEERRELLYKMWVVTHGLASLICVGLVKDDSNKYIIHFLMEIGRSVISDTLSRSNKQ